MEPFNSESSDTPDVNGSGSYVFTNYLIMGSRDPGDYVMNFTITDNLSGEKVTVTKDIVIAGEKEDQAIVEQEQPEAIQPPKEDLGSYI
jgi:hypothetical protein